MRKRLLTAMLVLALAAAQTAVFAQNEADNMPVQINENSENLTDTNVVSANYIKTEMTIVSAESSDDSLTLEGTDASGETINALIFNDTFVFDNAGGEIANADLKEGVKVSLYTRFDKPMTLQLPVTYRPDVVIVETEKEGFVDVDTYDENGVNAANTLKINDTDKTGDLIVFYTVSSKSIPASAQPSKVVSIETAADDNENNNKHNNTMGSEINTVDYTGIKSVIINGSEKESDLNIVVFNGNLMLPVRQICEKLNYEVAWDSNLSAVTVGSVPMGVNFAVGKNEYNKARMMPQKLSNAPIIVAADDEVNGLTYVPVEFFSEILEAEVTVDNDTLLINAQQ